MPWRARAPLRDGSQACKLVLLAHAASELLAIDGRPTVRRRVHQHSADIVPRAQDDVGMGIRRRPVRADDERWARVAVDKADAARQLRPELVRDDRPQVLLRLLRVVQRKLEVLEHRAQATLQRLIARHRLHDGRLCGRVRMQLTALGKY